MKGLKSRLLLAWSDGFATTSDRIWVEGVRRWGDSWWCGELCGILTWFVKEGESIVATWVRWLMSKVCRNWKSYWGLMLERMRKVSLENWVIVPLEVGVTDDRVRRRKEKS